MAAGACSPPPPPPLHTKWARRVPHPVLIGHAASLSQGLQHIGAHVEALPREHLKPYTQPRARGACTLEDVSREGATDPPPNGRFRARLKCPTGFLPDPTDL